MKKIAYLWSAVLFVAAFLYLPSAALAVDPGYLMPGGTLSLKAQVCKITNCLTAGAASDWMNFSTVSASPASSGGDAETLTVSPGDTLTFLGSTSVTGENDLDPVFGIAFTNGSYLGNIDVFGAGLSDVDGDTNNYLYASDTNITLQNGLTPQMISQLGAITATINANTPDQTVITGIFYVVDTGFRGVADLFGTKAYAVGEDTFLMSTVRIVVSNPAVQTATPTSTATPEVLPQTGAPTDNNGAKSTAIGISLVALAAILTFDLIRRKTKKT